MPGVAPSDVFLFEDFRLDRRGGLFRCNGVGKNEPVAIGSRALDILGVLIERAGEVVSKDEIIAAVWPKTVVEDSNVTVQISALRRVLDRGRPNRSCIQTVSRRGYRFIAPVAHPNAEVLLPFPQPDPGSQEQWPGLRSALSAASSTRRLQRTTPEERGRAGGSRLYTGCILEHFGKFRKILSPIRCFAYTAAHPDRRFTIGQEDGYGAQ